MRPSLLAGSVVFVIAASSCGGSGGNPAAPNPPPSNTTTISITGDRGNQSFSPNPANASQSDMVSWRNTDNQIHHIQSNDGSFDTGDIAPGASSPLRQLGVNGANYHCTIHPTMIGSINASSGAPPPCTGQYCE